jgi:hypothetical protein
LFSYEESHAPGLQGSGSVALSVHYGPKQRRRPKLAGNGAPIDSGARASPRQCEKEDKAVENLTVTGVMRHGDRVKPVMKGSVGSALSSTGGTTGRRQAKTNEDLSAEGSEMRHQGGTHRPVASAS